MLHIEIQYHANLKAGRVWSSQVGSMANGCRTLLSSRHIGTYKDHNTEIDI